MQQANIRYDSWIEMRCAFKKYPSFIEIIYKNIICFHTVKKK